jgi:hypothetical protein
VTSPKTEIASATRRRRVERVVEVSRRLEVRASVDVILQSIIERSRQGLLIDTRKLKRYSWRAFFHEGSRGKPAHGIRSAKTSQ